MHCVGIDADASKIDVNLIRENLGREAKLRVESVIKEKNIIDWHNLYRAQGKVCENKSRTHRSVISKLLAGCLKHQIEVDRYGGIDCKRRNCKLFECNLVEDNSHFLWECVKQSNEREPLVKYLGKHSEIPVHF